jgi:hypothetical protein
MLQFRLRQVEGEQGDGDRENGVGEEQDPVVLEEADAGKQKQARGAASGRPVPSAWLIAVGAAILRRCVGHHR